jgi:hypothetical protein
MAAPAQQNAPTAAAMRHIHWGLLVMSAVLPPSPETKPPASMWRTGGFEKIMERPGSVHAFVDLQPRHFVLQLQLAPLEFRQSEIVRGGMLEGLGELVFEHPMPLCKFCKTGRCSHVSSWSDFEPDSISLTRGKKGVDIRKVVRRSNAVDLAEQILPIQAESAADLEMSQAFATAVRRQRRASRRHSWYFDPSGATRVPGSSTS